MVKPEGSLSARNLWARLRREAQEAQDREPVLAGVFGHILNQHSFDESLASILASKLSSQGSGLTYAALFPVLRDCCAKNPDIALGARRDLLAVMERDPAATDMRTPFLYFMGYHALQIHRFAHHLWGIGRRDMARYLQSQCALEFIVDIHPAARIGSGVMLDHAIGFVVGETAVIEDDVSILHGVTLGGTGKEGEDRHPKIRKGVLLGAGATVLGNIVVGEGARVAAGSVVLDHVPAHTTVAGVPAKVVGKAGCAKPAKVMDQVHGVEPAAPEDTAYASLKTRTAHR